MAKKFPLQAIHVPVPLGSEQILAARNSDGEIVYFTPTELLSALLKLKTINGVSLFGTTDLVVGSSETAASIIQKLSVTPANNSAFLPNAKLSTTQFAQVTPGVSEITHNMDWFNAAVLAVGQTQGWGTGTPTPSLSVPVVTVTVISSTEIDLSWTASVPANGAGAINGYVAEKSLDSTFATGVTGVYNGAGRTAPATGLTPNTRYYFRVRANNLTPIYSAYGTANATTSAAGGVTLTNMTTPVFLDKMTFNLSTSTLTRDDNASGGGLYYARFAERIASGAVGTIQAKDIDNGTVGGIALVLHNSDGYSGSPSMKISRNPSNNKLEAVINGNYITLNGSISGDILMRLVLSATTVLPQYSTDNGATWIGSTTAALPTGASFFAQAYDGNNGATLGVIQHSGFTTS